MFTSLRLINFKAWEDTGTIALKPVTVLLGTNSSGKSSLIQSLLLLKQTVQSPDRSVHLNLGGDETNDLFNFGSFDDVLKRGTQSPREFSITFAFEAYEQSRVNEGRFSCSYRQTAVGAAAIQELALSTGAHRFRAVRKEKENYAIFIADETRPCAKDKNLAPERSIALPAEAIATLGSNGAIAEDLSLVIRRELENICYLGPFRRKPERDYVWNKTTPGQIESDGHRTIDVLLSGALSKDGKQNEILDGISYWLARMKVAEKLTIKQLGRSSRYEIIVHKDGIAANLRDVGIGIPLILPVLTAGYFAPPGSTVILEEPEVHLHPLAQSVLAEFFVRLSRSRHIQFIVETHSEHLFRRMQTLIARKETSAEQIAMLFVERVADNAILRKLKVDEFGRVNNWPQHFFGDALGETREQARLMLARQQEQN
ncbi:AAA family ATPase [Nitrosomonas eutropha]|uniref:Uncharacterized protein DUF3696 n=2 Tax=Nitrosomonas eutropha TaxID=916 RepID=A0ABX5M763_9PROT|nr:DUF3696 domain-containing protein [Nitrosomonas eutropha]ABI60194.1 conserved hypothetical protein [Nitrosomonas eutropha C91]PXV75073.1 uncharacterized protein DUF3696 [Nitrosomonas eutropha]SEI99448.1 Protein of unknown function [Nitrosomonas eutropha]